LVYGKSTVIAQQGVIEDIGPAIAPAVIQIIITKVVVIIFNNDTGRRDSAQGGRAYEFRIYFEKQCVGWRSGRGR
jgi:hypothetical protein